MRVWSKLLWLTLLVLLAAGCPDKTNGQTGGSQPVIVSSIFPVHDLVRRVGGDAIKAELLLQPGQSAHNFNPSPKLAKMVATSKAAFVVGLTLDDWAIKTVEVAGGNIAITKLGERVKTETFKVNRLGAHAHAPEAEHEHGEDDHDHGDKDGDHKDDDHKAGHDDHKDDDHKAGHDDHKDDGHKDADDDHDDHGDHHHGAGPDPHVWLAVPNAITMVDQIEQELSRVLPEKKATFADNATKLKEELKKLHAEIAAKVKTIKNPRIVTFHGSFGYFAAAYGLDIVAVIEPFPGKQPSAAYLKDVLIALKGKDVAALYTEPQLDPRPAKVLAEEAKLPLKQLDPLGGVDGRDSYEKLMRFNLAQLGD